jgi:hypothetical protein
MRYFLAMLFIMIGSIAFAQQGNPLPIVHQKMQALKWLSGKWEGTAYLIGQGGSKQEINHYLEFSPQLDGTVFLITENALVAQDTLFQNVGFLGYDFLQSKYNLHAFTNGGAQMEAYVEVWDDRMIWRFHAAGHIYRYTAHLNKQNQWRQVAEVSSDEGKSWTSFLESTLDRVK